MSILLKPEGFSKEQLLDLTTMTAVAVSEAIERISEKETGIKWVNDIFIEGRKVCGILCEASFEAGSREPACIVVGIGINAYSPQDGFPEEIAHTAGCVFDSHEAGNKNRLAAEILNRFMSYYHSGVSTAHFDEYRRRSILTDRDVDVIKGSKSVRAHVIGLDEHLGLIVTYPDGKEEVLRSGEVSIAAV